MTDIHNERLKLSSFKNILSNKSNTKNINLSKIININNFILIFNNKQFNLSLYYSNIFYISNNISSNMSINIFSNKKDFFKHNLILQSITSYMKTNNFNNDNFNDNNLIETLLINSNNYIKSIDTFIILWLIIKNIINDTNNILDISKCVNIYSELFKNYWENNLNISYIIDTIINNNNDLELLMINYCLYLLLEEFHYKYIKLFIKNNYKNNHYKNNHYKNNIVKQHYINLRFISSNYIRINPQYLLNNINNGFLNITDIKDTIEYPTGHNMLLIINNNYVYYYDPDIIILKDYKKLIKLFNYFIFKNISNNLPIQKITDDNYCIFYCLYLYKKLTKINFKKIRFNKIFLNNFIKKYENNLILNNCVFIKKIIKNILF